MGLSAFASVIPHYSHTSWNDAEKSRQDALTAEVNRQVARVGMPYTQALTDEVNAKNAILQRQAASAAGLGKYFQSIGQSDLGQRAAPAVATPDAAPAAPIDSTPAPSSVPVPGALPAPIAPIASAAPAPSTVPSSAPAPFARSSNGLPAPIAPTVATPVPDQFSLSQMYQDLISHGVHPIDAGGYVNTLLEQRQKVAANTKENLAIAKDNHDAVSDAYYNFVQAGPSEEGYQQFKKTALAREPGLQLPDHAPTDDAGRNLIAGQLAVAGKFLGAKKEQGEIDRSAAAAKRDISEAGSTDLKTQLTQAELDHFNTITKTPGGMEGFVAGQLNQQTHPDLYAHAISAAKGATSLQGLKDAIKPFVDTATQQDKEKSIATDPDIMKAHTAQAVATERATAPIKTSVAVATQRALNAGSGAGLANVPPHLVPHVLAEASKADTEYAGAINAANEMQSMIDLMRGGNKIAYAYSPVTGVLTINSANGTKRINMPEIKTYGGAGSAADNVEGWLKGKLTGESIPPQIVNAMEQMHGTLADVAQTNYTNKLKQFKTRYGADLQPTEITRYKPGESLKQNAPSGTIRVKRKADGQTGSIPAANFDASKYDKL